MAVNQSGDNYTAAGINDFVETVPSQIGAGFVNQPVNVSGRANPQNLVVFNYNSAIFYFLMGFAIRNLNAGHGGEDIGVFYK